MGEPAPAGQCSGGEGMTVAGEPLGGRGWQGLRVGVVGRVTWSCHGCAQFHGCRAMDGRGWRRKRVVAKVQTLGVWPDVGQATALQAAFVHTKHFIDHEV